MFKISISNTVVAALLTALLSASALQAQTEVSQADLKRITLLQVNDVYQEEPVDKGARGGLARVATIRNELVKKQPNTLFLLAGDTLSPSVASRTFKGKQMIACWNTLGVNYAVLGNHEFDFGPEVLVQRIAESKFQWICANVIDKRTGKLFDNLPPYVITDVAGVKVGIIGLLTPDTMRSSHAGNDIEILDPCKAARRYVPEMKSKGAQVIVALTHLTMSNDKQVAFCAPIDVVVGGHEHIVLEAVAHGTPIIKSGSDARNLGKIDVNYSPSQHQVYSVDWNLIPVTDKIADDPQARQVINAYESQLSGELDVPVADTTVELDATQVDNQTRETNLGDFIADAYRAATKTDVTLFNGGSIRSNMIYAPGKITKRDVVSILPFENAIVKMSVSGNTIRKALESGLSQIGIKAGGRFPQISGMTFSYDGSKKPGSRVCDVEIGGAPLQENKVYTLSTNNFVAQGGDDYTMLQNQELLATPEEAETEATVLQNALVAAKTIAPKVDGRIKRLDDSH